MYIFSFVLLFLSVECFSFNRFPLIMRIKKKKKFNNLLYSEMDSNKVILRKIENNECGDCKINKKYAPFAVAFTNLEHGSCNEIGYNIPNGYSEIEVPVIGKIKIERFLKK